jgi:hypothetical protein
LWREVKKMAIEIGFDEKSDKCFVTVNATVELWDEFGHMVIQDEDGDYWSIQQITKRESPTDKGQMTGGIL